MSKQQSYGRFSHTNLPRPSVVFPMFTLGIALIMMLTTGCPHSPSPPAPPGANAGPAQTVTADRTVTLDGNNSSGVPLTFTWTQTEGPVVTLSNAQSATPTFTAPSVTTSTGLTFQLVVENATGSSAPATVTITVLPAPNNPVYGLNFGPYVGAGQDPNTGSVVSATQITSLLTGLEGYSQWIRTFGTQNGLENVPPIAHQIGFKTAIGAFIGSDTNINNDQIANLVAAAQAGNVDLAIVGNEVLLNNLQSEAALLSYIHSVKSQVPANVQVTYADTWNTMIAHPNVIAAVDVVAMNIYPFYENAPIDQALSVFQADYAQIVLAANGKRVIITETGWPSAGSPPSSTSPAVPSAVNAIAYFTAVESWARSLNLPLFYFEAYDEPFKAKYGDYATFGIWDANGNLKSGMDAVFQK